MAVTIGEITVETLPPAEKPSSPASSSAASSPSPADAKKELEKALYHRESRARRLWDY
jgi:hypothetical protein